MTAREPVKAQMDGSAEFASESNSAHGSVHEDARFRGFGPLPVPMYGPFYGLNEAPFDLTPNPRFLYLTARQREAFSNIRYGLASAKGFTLILGDAGTGKTTLIRTALAEITDTPNRYVLVSNPTLGRAEFYEFLAREFGMVDEARVSKTRFLAELQLEVEARFAAGGLTGLIIDEAQSLPYELLEEIRLLGNIETPTSKLLNIVLSGQPELAGRLNDTSLRQLKQRIALRCELHPLTLSETVSYIAGRIRIAGGSPSEIFTKEAVIAIHEASAGIPRTINVLCDNSLISGFAAQVKPITTTIADDVCRDFDVNGDLAPMPAASGVQPGHVGSRGDDAAGLTPAADTRQAVPALPPERPMFASVNQTRKRRFKFF